MIKTFFKTLSLALFGKKQYEVIILEYGIDRPGEMDLILKVAHPDIGVFTAIDAVHSEQFGSPDAIAKEEIKMALHTKELVFLNHDDNYAMQLLPRLKIDTITYQTKGHDQNADIFFQDCDFTLGSANHDIKSAFSLHLKGKTYHITTNLIGKANYGYIGVALAITETLAYQTPLVIASEPKAKRGNLKNKKIATPSARDDNTLLPSDLDLTYQLQPGRLSIFAGKYNSIIFDSTYNAAPLSMRKTIDTAFTIRSKLFPNSEIRIILGDMRELGDLTEQEHRLLAGYVSQVADKLFLMGPQMTTHFADEIQKV
jgi:UDP-N-acetylmuramoyl-tripeptide--D-alanyl-D-alanine ligase